MTNKVLTIIVPTYNMEAFLEKNLQSLVVREELQNSLEVIVVNDGSKDSSSEIGHKFQNKYPETFCVIDKENGNYGSCINRGLKEATGKYIRVMDADDYYDTQGLERQIETLRTLDVDVMFTDYCEVNTLRGKNRIKSMSLAPNKVIDIEEAIKDTSFLDVQMHKITYKTENLRHINYVQLEGISYTDQEWDYLPMATVKTLYYLNTTVYNYLIGREGQTVETSISVKNLWQLIKIFFRMVEQYQEQAQKVSSEIQQYLYHRVEMNLLRIYTICIIWSDNMDNPVLKDFDRELESNYREFYVVSNDYLTFQLNHVKFIKRWRSNKFYDRLLLRTLRKGYAIILRIIEKNRN